MRENGSGPEWSLPRNRGRHHDAKGHELSPRLNDQWGHHKRRAFPRRSRAGRVCARLFKRRSRPIPFRGAVAVHIQTRPSWAVPRFGRWARRRSRGMAADANGDHVELLAIAPRRRLHREQAMEALSPGPPARRRRGQSSQGDAFRAARARFAGRRCLAWRDRRARPRRGDRGRRRSLRSRGAGSVAFGRRGGLRARGATLCRRISAGGAGAPESAEEPRERLPDLYSRVLKASGLWEQVLTLDPCDERAVRALMLAKLDAGDRGEVVPAVPAAARSLSADMVLAPEAATIAIYERALSLKNSEPRDVADRVRGLLRVGVVQLNSGEFADATQKGEEARSLAIAAALAREVGEASALLGLAAHMQDDGANSSSPSSSIGSAARPTPRRTSRRTSCVWPNSACAKPTATRIWPGRRESFWPSPSAAGSIPGRALAL